VIASIVAVWGAVRRAPGQAALIAMAAAVAVGVSYSWGLASGKRAVISQVASAELTKAQKANDDLRERVREGEKASMALRDELSARHEQIQSLKWSLKNVPKLVATQACPAPGDVRLSVGAVRLYDSALTGDGGELPGGAGRAAEGDASARVAGSEQPSAVTVDQFQDVAQVNAERFGECWVRLERLRNYLNARQAGGR
jgi:hypothetical protein